MAQAALNPPGGFPIQAWTVTCTRCGKPVSVTGAQGVAVCASCGASIQAEGLATVAGVARAPSPADPTDPLVGTRLGSWQLERLLGRGGMGRVYEAKDLGSGRRVALKVLSEALAQDPAFVRRFRREGKVLASLSHPHLVEVLDQGEDHGQVWFAMEYVRGETLRRRLERGVLTPEEALRIASEICSALAYAHDKGVVHRDLKPENVLLGEDGRVRLADFGLLRLVRESTPESTTRLTRTDVILGTYEYMAPEQRREAGEVDGRSDLFSLGVMLYEGLTGQLPLGRFTPAGELVPRLPRGVDPVIHRALAPEPKQRFATARDMAQALAAAFTPGAPHGHGPDEFPARGDSALRLPQAVDAALQRSIALEPKTPEAASRDLAQSLGAAEDARYEARFLHHADLLATLDKVAGVLLMLACVVPALALPFRFGQRGFGLAVMPLGLLLFGFGLWLLSVGKRMRRLEAGARDAQILASVLMLLLFPLGTALGIYGLIVMVPLRARLAFERARGGPSPRWSARGALTGAAPPPPPPVTPGGRPLRRGEVLVPEPRHGAGLLPRLLLAAALLWTLFLGFGATRATPPYGPYPVAQRSAGPERDAAVEAHLRAEQVQQNQMLRWARERQVDIWLQITALGAAFALFVSIFAWRRRALQRGFGMAFASLLILSVDLAALGVHSLSLWHGAWIGP